MLNVSRTSRTAFGGGLAGIALATLVAVPLALTLAGCHSATTTTGSAKAGSPLSCWPQSPFTSQRDQTAAAAKNDPFPDANQPLHPLNTNVTCHE